MLRELVEAQRRFPTLFAAGAAEPKALFALDGTLVHANEAALRLIGGPRKRGNLAEAEAEAILPHCNRAEVREAFRTAAMGTAVEFTTAFSRAPDAPATDVRATFAPAIVDEAIVGVHATARDITREADAARRGERRVQELASLFEGHIDAMIALDARGAVTGINPAGERLTGFARADLLGRSYASLIAPEALASTHEIFARGLRGDTVAARTTLRSRSGARVEVSGTAIPILVDGAVVGVYAVGRNVVEEFRHERESRAQAERVRELCLLAATSETTVEAQIRAALTLGRERLDCDGGYVTRIENGIVTFLYGAGDVEYALGRSWPLGESLHRHVVAAERPVSFDDVTELAGEPSAPSLPRSARAFVGTPLAIDGKPFGTLCFVSRTRRSEDFSDADRDFVRLIGTLASNAIDRDGERRRLSTLAFYDALTSLPNRVLLSDRLSQAIAVAQRDGTLFAVHFYDLDGFKAINDAHGHLRGDDVLRLVARRFERVARDVDTVARVGGDEFVVVQPGVGNIDDAVKLARRLRAAIAEPFIVDGRERHLSSSAGIALFPQDGADAATLIARADAALYRVKANGRDDIAFVIASDD